jgi:hypothetical protein
MIATKTPKRGDVREDGMVFWSRTKNLTSFTEWWVTVEHYNKIQQVSNDRRKWRYHNDPAYRAKEKTKNCSELARARKRKWNKANRAYMDSFQSARRAIIKGNAILLSDNEKALVKDVYAFRDILNKQHGRAMFHVDHCQPICRGGLHHPNNLRVTTAHYNVTKATN